MEYLEGEEPSIDALKADSEKVHGECAAVPVLLWFCIQKQRCSEITDAILEFMPAPTDTSWLSKGVDMDGNEIERHSSDEEPFSALAFKIMAAIPIRW